MKRKLFSQKDGTKIGEDIHHIIEEGKAKLWGFVRKFGDDAERIIEVLKLIDEQIREGTPTDLIIDKVLAQIPGHADEAIYKFIQENLEDFISDAEKCLEYLKKWDKPNELPDALVKVSGVYESLRHKTASILLQDYLATKGEQIDRVTSDTTIQVVYQLNN